MQFHEVFLPKRVLPALGGNTKNKISGQSQAAQAGLGYTDVQATQTRATRPIEDQ